MLDAGVAPQPGAERPAGVVRTGLRPSRNLAVEAALDDDQLDVALATGRRMANDARARRQRPLRRRHGHRQHDALGLPGSLATGRGAADVCGQGTGVDDPGLARKRAVGPEPAHGLLLDHLGLEPLLDPRMRLGKPAGRPWRWRSCGWPARCTPGWPPSTSRRRRTATVIGDGRVAVGFLTRLPIGGGELTAAGLSRAAAWFPVGGLLVGGVMAATRALAGLVLDPVPSTASPCWPPWW